MIELALQVRLELQNQSYWTMVTAHDVWKNKGVMDIVCDRFRDKEVIKAPPYTIDNTGHSCGIAY